VINRSTETTRHATSCKTVAYCDISCYYHSTVSGRLSRQEGNQLVINCDAPVFSVDLRQTHESGWTVDREEKKQRLYCAIFRPSPL